MAMFASERKTPPSKYNPIVLVGKGGEKGGQKLQKAGRKVGHWLRQIRRKAAKITNPDS